MILHLTKQGVIGFRFARTPINIGHTFFLKAGPLFSMKIAKLVASRALVALRDALLPKLLCGEIQVKDVERFLEESGL